MIRSLADLPFQRREPLDLLNLGGCRPEPDPDYTGFGWTRCDVGLESRAGGPVVTIHDALVLALHTTEGGHPGAAGDLELEFVVDDPEPGASIVTPLSAFLRVWGHRLHADAPAVVLALCNPRGVLVARPPGLGQVPLHYASGDVESWLDSGEIRLLADAWRLAV